MIHSFEAKQRQSTARLVFPITARVCTKPVHHRAPMDSYYQVVILSREELRCAAIVLDGVDDLKAATCHYPSTAVGEQWRRGNIVPCLDIFARFERRSRNSSRISNNAKYDGPAAHFDIRTVRVQSAHCRIERTSSRSWNGYGALSSREPRCFRIQVMVWNRNGSMQ